jgi:hypothetical protein
MQSGLICSPVERPALQAQFLLQNTEGGYNKAEHAAVMNELINMAVQCDVTRVITHMTEHERSEFVCDHITRKNFTTTTWTEGQGMCQNYHGAQHGNAEEFASITQWDASQVAALCERLAQIEDAPGVTALDNSIILFASCMDGNPHYGNHIPTALIGGAGGKFKTNQHIAFPDTPGDRAMRDLYFTIMNGYFELGVTDFGNNIKGTPISMISELMA